MYWFGLTIENKINVQDIELWKDIYRLKQELAKTDLDEILNLLDNFSKENFEEIIPEVMHESGFSIEETKKTLSLLPGLLSKNSLRKRLKAEFSRTEVLDKFCKLPNGQFKVRAIPKGLLLHVTAGNVFLSSIDSLIMGLITKNLSIVKVSGQNQVFPYYFAQKLKAFDKKNILSDKFAILHWKGGEQEIETFIKNKVNAILAWGGEEMIRAYAQNLPTHIKLLDFGPKISIQVVSKNGIQNKNLSQVARNIVADIVPWDQSACASPQNLYIQDGVDEELLFQELHKEFTLSSPRGHIDEDEATELLKEKYRGYYSQLMDGGKVISGEEHLIHSESSDLLRPSPLHRTLIVKKFKNPAHLKEILEPFSYYLQSCSYLLSPIEKDEYLNELCLTGIKRFAPLGTITWGMEGAPHDGRYVLRELISFVGDELRIQTDDSDIQIHDSNYLKNYFNSHAHPAGYIFSSGGTTGEPKFLHFSYEEFDYMSDMLAENFKAQGIESGMKVANLFVAGNLWSSFLCVEKALEKIGAIQLPIGGLCSQENIALYLSKFLPDVVMGIPSLLVTNAEYMDKCENRVKIPFLFYAGEVLSESRRNFLSKVWGVKYFGSAGYASVDAGVIGYQCDHCGPGEHHLFSDLIDLKIINDEAVVTSIARNTMPVDNYRTGDRVEWIKSCSCGRKDKRFKLLGRIDNVIQIWSCRLLTTDVESVMNEFGIISYQLKISEQTHNEGVVEILKISLEASESLFNKESFLLNLYQRSRDVKDTISFQQFSAKIILDFLKDGAIERNPRTGKIKLVLDLRK